MKRIVTTTWLPSGASSRQEFYETGEPVPAGTSHHPADPAKAYGELQKPEPTIFERTTFRWIRGVS